MTAVENLEKAKDRLSNAETMLVDAQVKCSEARTKNEAAQKLAYTGALTPKISDERFAYLNDKVAAVVASEKAYEEKNSKLAEAKDALAEKQAVLAEVQEAYATALAELAIAQRDYDAIVKTPMSKTTISGISTKTYSGKPQTQAVVVEVDGKTLKLNQDYTVSYKNNTAAGKKAVVVIKGIGKYSGEVEKTFTIEKAANEISVKARKTKSVKAAIINKKKTTVKSLASVKNYQGQLVYSNASKSKTLKKFKINSKTGAITIAKGTKKGFYKIRVKVTAKGDSNYAAKTKYVTVRVRIK